MLGAGDAFMSGFLRGWLGGESRSRPRATWANACGAFAVSRLLCSPEYPTWTELQYLPRSTAARTGRCARTRRSTTSTGRRRGARDIPSLMALAIDHRVAARGDRRRRPAPTASASRAFKVLAVKAAAQVADGRAGFGMLLDEKYGREALFESPRHEFSWIGRPVELPGSRPLRFEFSAGHRLAAGRMAGRPLHQGASASIIPTIRPTLKARAEREAARAVRGGAQGRPRAADRDHRRQARHARRRHDRRARSSELYDARHQARLVEARAAGLGRRLGDDRGGDRAATIRGAAASCCSASSAAGRARSGLRRDRRCADREGLRRRPHDLRRCRRSNGWPASIDDEAAIADMAGALREARPRPGLPRAAARRHKDRGRNAR